MNSDPYHDDKKYHLATLIGSDGKVSALCFERPRAINLEIALWTICEGDVTCKKCLQLMEADEPDQTEATG